MCSSLSSHKSVLVKLDRYRQYGKKSCTTYILIDDLYFLSGTVSVNSVEINVIQLCRYSDHCKWF